MKSFTTVLCVVLMVLSLALLENVSGQWVQQGYDSSHSHVIPFAKHHPDYAFNYTSDSQPNKGIVAFDVARGKAVSFVDLSAGIVAEYDLVDGSRRILPHVECPSFINKFYTRSLLIDNNSILYVIGSFMIGEASLILSIDLKHTIPQKAVFTIVQNRSELPIAAVLSQQHGLLVISYMDAISAYSTSTLKLVWHKPLTTEGFYEFAMVPRGEQGNANEILYAVSVGQAVQTISIPDGKILKSMSFAASTVSVIKGAPNWLAVESTNDVEAKVGILNLELGFVSFIQVFNITKRNDWSVYCNSPFGRAVEGSDGIELQVASNCGFSDGNEAVSTSAMYGYSMKVGKNGKPIASVKKTWQKPTTGFFIGGFGKEWNVLSKLDNQIQVIDIATGALLKSAKEIVNIPKVLFYEFVSTFNNILYLFGSDGYQAINLK